MRFDEKEKAENYVRFTKFDSLGRIVASGIKTISSNTTRSDIQTAFYGMTNETYEETGTALLGYTNRSSPNAYAVMDSNIKSVMNYNDYSQIDMTGYGFKSSQAFYAQGANQRHYDRYVNP
jgi:hypothetical protein